MKPVRLTIQAFGPYPEREVIDFRDAVEAGLFGIYGQTGSGKSTIFSAMTFALFGEPAKTEQETPSLRSDHAAPTVATEVELVFDVSGKRFVIVRRPDQMRPKQRGDGETRSPHEAFLFDATGLAPDEINEDQRGKVIAEKKVRDVDLAVSELLGYGPEQFRQIVLLPQGRFETFLSAKTKERLDILRDLFDVSLYQSLMVDLKAKAETAERSVREERELCARQLSSEGFESTDALIAGIVGAVAERAQRLETEKVARATFASAQTTLRDAEAIEAKFKIAEESQKILTELQAHKSGMDALAERVVKAERARSMIDTERHVEQTRSEVRDAEKKLAETQVSAVRAEEEAKSAAEALNNESSRADDIERLRRKLDEFERFKLVLDKAAGGKEKVEAAKAAERQANHNLNVAQQELTDLQGLHREKAEALKVFRQSEGRRKDITTHFQILTSSLIMAKTYEKAENEVLTAQVAVQKQTSKCEAAIRLTDDARSRFEEAERSLSEAQALHLASKLEAGEPCPVCGATEHPAPTTGATEHAGLDQAFREAKAAWERADKATRAAAETLAEMRGTLGERQERLTSLDRPDESVTTLKDRLDNQQKVVDDLGPEADINLAEVEIEQLGENIAALQTNCDALRDAFYERRREMTAETTRFEEMLSTVPGNLRDPDALAAARSRDLQALSDQRAAKAAAEKAAVDTREVALAAQKDQQAADSVLLDCRNRYRKEVEAFQLRLGQAGISENDFHTLKPAVETVDVDREKVDEYQRRLENGKEAAIAAAAVIEALVRADLQLLEAMQHETEERLTKATEGRVGAATRVDHLEKLQESLAKTLQRLGEEEAASGPLRKLAALVNGDNQQKLDLETFAIGAMFDQVLEAANLRLGPMTASRYRLERDIENAGRGRRGLGIHVFDNFTGKARSTTTLSGGETFIAALALALGLADVVESSSGKVRLDTIFIDEGFGSLDTESGSGTLDQVLQALSSLVSQNRAVGLISHVPLVQEVIPNGFYVRKHHTGSSVEVRRIA
ncbi:MAG: AAA family ATPase [Parvibaculum sp.]|nr:AAA family ATPase [Parvibaculum sp.]